MNKTTQIDKKPAYLYSRVSTLRQEEGEGIERQKRLIEDFISKEGYYLADSYEDIGKSAYKAEHLEDDAGLGQFLNALKDGNVKPDSCLVIEQLDRLGRMGINQSRIVLSTILSLKCSLAIVRMGIVIRWDDAGDIGTDVQVGSAMAMAHHESLFKSQRVLATFDIRLEKARAGIKWTSKSPWWMNFDQDKKDFYENEHTYTARTIIDLCLKDGWGSYRICNFLNANLDRYPRPATKSTKKDSKRKIPAYWTKTSVYYVLKSIAIFGQWQPKRRQEVDGKRVDMPNGDPIDNYYMPIATENEFYRIKMALEKNTKVSKDGKKRGIGGEKGRFANLYRGMTKCWVCGTAMARKKGYSKDYLSCNAQGGICNTLSSSYDDFEDLVVDLMKTSKALVKPENTVNSRLEIIALEAEVTKQNDIINKQSILIDSLDDATPEVLGIFAKKINKASIKKSEIISEIETLRADSQDSKVDESQLMTLDLSDAGDRETYNNLISRDIEIISVTEGFALVRRHKTNAYAMGGMEYSERRYISISDKTSEHLFDYHKENNPDIIVDNFSFRTFRNKSGVSKFLSQLRQQHQAADFMGQYKNGDIDQKRLLRLLRDKYKIDYPHALREFKDMFVRGAIYKLMNFDYVPISRLKLSKFETFKDYQEWISPDADEKGKDVERKYIDFLHKEDRI